jgi:DNA-binding winged helix-turn-helix (wHTH) protein
VLENQSVSFGPYHFEPHNAQLRRGKRVLPLTRKASAVLQCLVAQPGQLVTKDALFQAVWPETVVSEGVLTNCIVELRQALGDDAKRPRFIATVHRQGYRFLAPVTVADPPALAPAEASLHRAMPVSFLQGALPAGSDFLAHQAEGNTWRCAVCQYPLSPAVLAESVRFCAEACGVPAGAYSVAAKQYQ